MIPCILFRPDNDNQEEFEIAKKHFEVYTLRSEIPSGRVVFPRYSALPFYKELEQDLINRGSELVNSTHSFNWIANFEYYEVLKDYTFKTYFDPRELPDDKSFVVKGRTNSRKHQWDKFCFAKDKRAAVELSCELSYDPLIGTQGIIFREYEPLKTFETLINGLKVAHEYRTFYYRRDWLSSGFYWSCAENKPKHGMPKTATEFSDKIAGIVSRYVNFFVVDIAEKENGEWVLVELNSGEMAGLSDCNANTLYHNLSQGYDDIDEYVRI